MGMFEDGYTCNEVVIVLYSDAPYSHTYVVVHQFMKRGGGIKTEEDRCIDECIDR